MNIKAIIFGATGMVGEGVLQVSLNHQAVESVLVIGRRPCKVTHPKLKEIILKNIFDLKNIEDELNGYNACFFCLGVSSIGMKEEDYKRITYDLTMSAAKTLAALNPGMTFCYVSGTGTDSTEKGRLMWARIKGKTENDLSKLPFKDAYMFRPGFIKPLKGLKNAYTISKAAGIFYPVLKILFPKYVCTLEDLGLAMIQAAEKGFSIKILENKDIQELALLKN
ncbi:MAG: epimerase [Ignavibacteria bacterium]